MILQEMELTLLAAIKGGDINNVKRLIKAGADTTVEDSVR